MAGPCDWVVVIIRRELDPGVPGAHHRPFVRATHDGHQGNIVAVTEQLEAGSQRPPRPSSDPSVQSRIGNATCQP
jgi:hypothetical protein